MLQHAKAGTIDITVVVGETQSLPALHWRRHVRFRVEDTQAG